MKLFFWLKSLHQLGFVCFFGFYFWIGLLVAESDPKQKETLIRLIMHMLTMENKK
ncbi:Putative DNA-binding protein in cluster with Type I restriction-modification system [uncultured Gammaproteobacteria bacterium]|nr:Putative DNA-binding protein in cluster with Type I restriction-modification system [uncultured Gammaproteobacteria bacterium]VVH60540.1 Putative DNA-binding protein in cluster with Type I restriction-modification system [uncultured Gammaproteobacteria bacterium]